jgi:hypothetical protein
MVFLAAIDVRERSAGTEPRPNDGTANLVGPVGSDPGSETTQGAADLRRSQRDTGPSKTSLAMSTPVSTDMPTSAIFSAGPVADAVAEKSEVSR